MGDLDPSVPLEDNVYVQAAEWIELLGERPLDTLSERRLQKWLNAHPAHRKLLTRMIASWADPALLEILKQYDQRQPWWRFSKANDLLWPALFGISLASVVSIVFLTINYLPRQAAEPPAQVAQVYLSAQQTQQHTLADGSVITQSGESEMMVALTDSTRRIALRKGAAFFDVASDKQRPFQVDIQNATVVAVGTQFNVDKTAKGVAVTVYEGAVEVRANAQSTPTLLRSGEKTLITEAGLGPVVQVDIAKLVDWRSGWIEMQGEPLEDLLEQLNRHNTAKVKVLQSPLGGLPVAGRFQLGNAAQTVELLSQFYDLKVQQQGGHYFLSREQ